MPVYSEIAPSLLSLPDKFSSFRREQAEAIDFFLFESFKQFTACGLPTGAGKTLFAMAAAKALGVKAAYLCATRGLQDQAVRDFAAAGAVDVRGRANYECTEGYLTRKRYTCADGHDDGCVNDGGARCPYNASVEAARQSDIVVTNYSYWLHARKYQANALTSDDRPFGLVILDEVPEAVELVADFVSVRLSEEQEELPVGAQGDVDSRSGIMPSAVWTTFATERKRTAADEIARLRKAYTSDADAGRDQRVRYLREVLDSCDRILRMDSNWVWEVSRKGVSFTPIRPGPYCRTLWSGIPRVLLISATLRPYTLQLLGLSDADYDFREWPAVFQPGLGPVYYHPVVRPDGTPIKLNHKSPQEDLDAAVAGCDAWLEARQDRKALIQTGSYERARVWRNKSRFGHRFHVNENGYDAMRAAEDYRRDTDGAVLCSPSFVAGWDFAGRQCELVLIPKIPYPDTRSRVVEERCKDGEYRHYSATQDIVQGAGRARRFETDRCEVVIRDAGFRWLQGSHTNPFRGHAPKSFRVQEIGRIPAAPPRVRI